MSNNLKNALTKGILLVFILNMSLSGYTAYAQVSFAAPPVRDSNIVKTEIVPEPLENLIAPSDAVVTATPEPEIKPEEKAEETAITDAVDENQVAEKEISATDQLFYIQLMRAVRDLKLGKAENLEKEKIILAEKLDKFIQQEKTKLEKSGVKSEKLDSYFKLLYTQIEDVKSLTPSKIEEYISKEKSDLEVKSVKKPSLFKFADEKVFIKSIKISDSNLEPATKISFLETINPFIIATAQAAAPQFMPVIEDIQENPEVVISSDIKTLADELHRNPVEILNYVYANIDYEPYYGAKKGSDGCLKEKVCNDTDSASLTIALMRASGIPARYRKGVAVMPVQQIKELLGVDEVKTAYFAFAANKVPVYVLSGNNVGTNVDLYNFAQETHLAVEWTYPEIFYDYDERGANFPNTVDLSAVQTTQELRDLFTDTHKKQWIPADGITKTYTRVQHQIVHDTVAFNTQNFWNGFLQYQGALSPFDKYKQDLQTQTGKDITTPLYQTVKTKQARTFNILPSTRPYVFAQGVDSNGVTINIETWSQLPDVRRFKVSVSLLKASDQSVVLNKNFYSSEINNVPVDVMYEGATTTDQQTIDSYGGIHMTPASLVNIKPYFLSDYGKYETTTTTTIGEPLILQFEYFVNGNSIYTDQKNSVAGNMEGIYIILSKLQDDPALTDGYDDNSQILLEGNAKLAWKYIREVEVTKEKLEKAFDYELNNHFIRAVITQNRILSEVGGVPTTFDFKGLTMDASSYINDYSNRGNFKLHNKDFRLIWGLNASYYEGQIFTDVTNVGAISTVKGLQYAYANPGTYTIHTITTANESVIDTLNLSANTKQNMHADVQAGRTITTPNKQVTQGTFTGTLYASIESNGTGTYAIGEQNGAWVFDTIGELSYCEWIGGIQYRCNVAYEVVKGASIYLFEDNDYNLMHCNITQQRFDDTLNESDWDYEYGFPCYVPSVPPGQTYPYEYVHPTDTVGITNDPQQVYLSFKIATNATKFWRGGTDAPYSYWHKNLEIFQKFKDYAANYNLSNLINISFAEEYGTYINKLSQFDEILFYSPKLNGTNKGEIFDVQKPFLTELNGYAYDTGDYICAINNPRCGSINVFDYLGFPISNPAAINSNWLYQNFIGGRIYMHISLGYPPISTYYVLGQINNYYLSHGGLNTYGYPLGDPKWDPSLQILHQDYENNNIDLVNQVTTDGHIIANIQSEYVANHNDVYWEGFFDQITEEGIVGLAVNMASGYAVAEVINKGIPAILKKAGAVKLVPFVGWIFLAYSVAVSAGDFIYLVNACNTNNETDGAPKVYYCGKKDALMVLVGLGAVGQGVANTRLAKNIFYTGKESARNIKNRIFEKLSNKAQVENYAEIQNVSVTHKRKFFENLTDAPDISLTLLATSKRLIKRMAERSLDFYSKFRINSVYLSYGANLKFPQYTNPVPFPYLGVVTELRVSSSVSRGNFVRFHRSDNQTGAFIMDVKDIPFKSDGKIDVDKLKDLIKLPYTPTHVSDYNPATGDLLIEGQINQGSNPSVMQYALDFNGSLVPSDRFVPNLALTDLL